MSHTPAPIGPELEKKMSRAHRAAFSLAAASVLALAGSTVVSAAAPARTEEPVHIAATFPAGTRCPFEVSRTIDGVLVTTVFTDRDGLTRTTFLYEGGKIVYTNPANGATLTAVLAGPAVYIDNGDGTTTVRVPGNDQRYVGQGIGFIVGNTGLVIATVDTDSGAILSIDFEAGHQDGTPFPALCVGLE
jgi:hypothetical protein